MALLHRAVPLLMLLLAALQGSIGRPLTDEDEEPDAAVELTVDSFNETLWAAPAAFALVEFYAHWCPICRIYKPQYSRVAKLFNGRNAAHPGEIFVAKVDCAEDANTKICRRFQVDRYPLLFWGAPGKFAFERFDPKAENGLEMLEKTPRSAESLLEWINQKIKKTYALTDVVKEVTEQHRTGVSDQIIQVAKPMLSLYDIEESTTLFFKIILQQEMLTSRTRVPFMRFLQLLAVHHPSQRCRKGSANILVHFEDVWLAGEDAKPNYDLLSRLGICGERKTTGAWVTCRGSVNGTRGYSCGLWLLFHALSVRIDDADSKTAVQTIRDFVGSFFNCEECRDHFMKMSSSAASLINSRRDLVLWFWRSHNEVNERVGNDEAKDRTGDPQFPKRQWPLKEVCTACRSSIDDKDPGWDETAVYTFLTEYFGRALTSIPEDKLDAAVKTEKEREAPGDDISSSRVAVPIGAAFGIAVASCGFGLVACFWRMQQKRKKLLRRRM